MSNCRVAVWRLFASGFCPDLYCHYLAVLPRLHWYRDGSGKTLTLVCGLRSHIIWIGAGYARSRPDSSGNAFIVRWQVKQRLPIGWLLIGLMSFFLLNSVKGEYRQRTWWSAESLSFDQRIGIWLELSQNLAQQTLQGQAADESESPWQVSLQRFDLLHQFVYIHNMTPHYVSYFDGSTYSYLFYGWIPRVLWPDKPTASDATDVLAVSYDFLMPQQVGIATIGIGLLPEAYANFGAWGIIPILALQGMFLALVSIVLNGPRSEGGRAIYLSVMIFFLNGIGTQTALLFSALLPRIIGSAIIIRPFAHSWSATPKNPRDLRHLVPQKRKFEATP